MITATCLEVMMLVLMIAHRDTPTRLLAFIVWAAYFWYSATRALLARLAQWLHDHSSGPPGGPA